MTGTVTGKWGKYVDGFWKELDSLTPETLAPVHWERFHLSTKKGPSAQHAVQSWLTDFISIPDSLKGDIAVVGGNRLLQKMRDLRTHLVDFIKVFKPKKSGVFRRIEAISDSEGKSRVVAILDYWSQTALKPLHSYLFRILEKIPQDVTFDQGSFVNKTLKWDRKEEWFSVDLSKATDRFPIKLISQVLRGALTDKYVDAWERIMVGYKFHNRLGDDVSYAVGNPMGAYSSWGSFALSHHFVMYRVARELGRPWSALPYVVLGDDVLIGDHRVGQKYLTLIKELGLDVSPDKTYVSKSICEFAKRYLREGREITPFPISSVSESVEVPVLVSSLLGETRKGYFPVDGIPVAVKRLVKASYPKLPEHMLMEVEAQAFHCEISTKFFSGVTTASEFIALLCDHHAEEVTDLTGETLLKTAFVDILTESLAPGEGSFITEFDRIEDLLQGPTVPRTVVLHNQCVPVLSLATWVDVQTMKMEHELARVSWTRDEWKDIVSRIHNPFGKYSFDSTPVRIRARIGHRLGAKVRSYFEDPLKLAVVNAQQQSSPFISAGLVIILRERRNSSGEGKDSFLKEWIKKL